MTDTTTTIPPFVGTTMEEQVANYLLDHRDVLLNGSYTRSRLADHCQVSVRLVTESVRMLCELLEPTRETVCELERRHGYVVRLTSDPVIYGRSTLTRRRCMRTELLRWKSNYTAIGATQQARNIGDMLVSLDADIATIEAELAAAVNGPTP